MQIKVSEKWDQYWIFGVESTHAHTYM